LAWPRTWSAGKVAGKSGTGLGALATLHIPAGSSLGAAAGLAGVIENPPLGWGGAAAAVVGADVGRAVGGTSVLAGDVAGGAWPPHAAVKTRLTNNNSLSFDMHPSFIRKLNHD